MSGATQRDVADALRTTPVSVGRYLAGTRRPCSEFEPVLVRILGEGQAQAVLELIPSAAASDG